MNYTNYNMGPFNLHVIKNDHFKTVKVKVNFKSKLVKDEITIRNLLRLILINGTKKYPSERLLSIESENLYDLGYSSVGIISGNFSILSFELSFLNPKYTDDVSLDDYIDFLCEILFNPNIHGKKFDTESFDLVKEKLKNTIESEVENPRKYALNRLLEEMDKEEIEELNEEKEEREDKDENDLSEKQSEKIKVNGIQKANLNKLVDGKETLGKRLDLEEYDSVYVVYSEKVKEVTANSKINNTTYSLVGMTKDGEARVLNDEFEMDKTVGNNASREQTKIRADGTATRDNEDLSVYTRKSNGISIGCENSQGSVQMFMYQKTLEENENVGIQIETSKTPVIPIETKEIMNRNKGIEQKERIQNEVDILKKDAILQMLKIMMD